MAWLVTLFSEQAHFFTYTVCLLEGLVGLREAKVLPKPLDGGSGRMRLRGVGDKGAETVDLVHGRRDGDCLRRGRRSLRENGAEKMGSRKLAALRLPSQPHVSSPQPPRPGASSRTCCSLRLGLGSGPTKKPRVPTSSACRAARPPAPPPARPRTARARGRRETLVSLAFCRGP